jgi:DNA recombination protein RmuC
MVFDVSLGVGMVVILGLLLRLNFFGREKSVSVDIERLDRQMRDEMARFRQELSDASRVQREEVSQLGKLSNDLVMQQLAQFSVQLLKLIETNDGRLKEMRDMFESRMKILQDDNNKKLEEMRVTVDEKLHLTLEKRLGESFKLVGDRLELVHKGLGEMQTLASGVGDLKKVLTNVKTRGTWGEVQLEALLEQIFTVEQYDKNVRTNPNTRDTVEFAIKLPGKMDGVMWLPIDSKCPQDPYQRMIEAQELGDAVALEVEGKQFEMMIKREAKAIKDKYIDPPHTTDFAILFLPMEGMFAEVLRRRGLHDVLQRDYRVLVAGPTTLGALLNSLQMGFKTLAIEKRSSEVWEVLGKVKTEFMKFGGLIEKTKKKLQEATNSMEVISSKSRNIEGKLSRVEMIDVPGSTVDLGIEEIILIEDEEE